MGKKRKRLERFLFFSLLGGGVFAVMLFRQLFSGELFWDKFPP